MTPEWVQGVAAIATFFAAGLAVWAAFRGPELAAQFAEKLRVQNQASEQIRTAKLNVFATLMQNRSAIASPNSVAALNLIDVIFVEDPQVRAAWRDFHASTVPENKLGHAMFERYHQILERMARSLGLIDQISIIDIRTSYYPTALTEMDEAALLEARDKLARFRPPLEPT